MNLSLDRTAESPLESSPYEDQARKPTFRAHQACNECRRRKGKCDRIAPECGTCTKYSRHCLYEQHSKSPLTRKHLTYVEHRLEAATAELHILRRQLQSNSTVNMNNDALPLNTQSSNSNQTTSNELQPAIGIFEESLASQLDSNDTLHTMDQSSSLGDPVYMHEAIDNEPDESSHIPFEGPPTTSDDFDWDEQDIDMDSEWLEIGRHNGEDSAFVDGMASLSVDEQDTGYLGVASGAALLRLLKPDFKNSVPIHSAQTTSNHESQRFRNSSLNLQTQPDPNYHILDAMIDGYFRTYHISYPIVHEPRFRAQYTEVIPRPKGKWKALLYMVAAIGAFSSATGPGAADVALFNAARSNLSVDDLESGNISLVQTLTLISNYLQKRNKPNSGYNYLGLALRMAMGLGLHKEFPKWDISPLQMEIRRRVWWTLFVFDIGATITFSRPIGWPQQGIEVALPLNVHDRNLTAAVSSYPQQIEDFTTYSAVRAQATFHRATNSIYTRVISIPFPTSQEVLSLDKQHLVPWLESLPSWYSETSTVPSIYAFSHAVNMWRYHNLRLIMYRPFVIRLLLKTRQILNGGNTADQEACHRCLNEATVSVKLISEFWSTHPHTKLASWYALYFLFQASLVPVFCLRNDPLSASASPWRQDINLALAVFESMFSVNSSSIKCFNTIQSLCGQYLTSGSGNTTQSNPPPTEESPHTQINNAYSMMWPNIQLAEADVAMHDDAWLNFLGDLPPDEQQYINNDIPEEWSFT